MGIWTCEGWLCRSLLGVLAALVLTLIIAWLGPLHPLFETVTNVRAQLVPLTLILVVGFLILQRWQFAAVAVAVLFINAAYLLPYLTPSPDPVGVGADTITVMQYNVYFGNDDYDSIARHVIESDADVVALHELLPDQWDELDSRLADEYPHIIAAPLAETDGQPGGGMALLSRTPLTPAIINANISPIDRVTLVATVEIGDREVRIIGLHPHASRTDSAKVALRERQLTGVAGLVSANSGPTIILTDLNVAPTSPVYQGFLDEMGWRDPHRVVGWKSSWPSWGGRLGLPIDHVLVSNEFFIHSYRIGDGAGSDHKSIVAEVSLSPVPAG